MTACLEADRITFAYAERVVLRDFSLAAERGTFTALLGPNGSGKTTVLRVLSRLLRPREGTVTLDGQDIWQMSRRSFVLRAAFVPQTEATSWPMTVEQVVLLGRMPHRGWLLPYSREDREAIQAALRQVELTGFEDRDLNSLSGGERRRAMLARALAQNAQILLLDEPGAHLDLRHQMELFALLRRLSHQCGANVVLSLHDLNLASLFADHIVLLREGSLVAQGPPREVMTAELIRATFDVETEVIAKPRQGVPMVLPILSPGDELEPAGNGPGLAREHQEIR